MLILHEIGHTLGLTHNMRASQLQPDVFDAQAVEARGLSGSVMDYEAVNVAPEGKTQTWFYQKRPGPYDVWALQYGYGEYSDAQLQALLARSTEAELAYGNDADDMRRSGNGIDPHINIYDLSSDAIGYAEMRLAHLRTVQERLPGQYRGESYQGLVNAFAALMSQYRRSGGVISRYVGGIHIDRQPPSASGRQPYTPVSAAQQRRAMDVLKAICSRQTSCRELNPVCPTTASAKGSTFMANRKIQKSMPRAAARSEKCAETSAASHHPSATGRYANLWRTVQCS